MPEVSMATFSHGVREDPDQTEEKGVSFLTGETVTVLRCPGQMELTATLGL